MSDLHKAHAALSAQPEAVMAEQLAASLKWPSERLYGALVALEARGHAEVVIEHRGPRRNIALPLWRRRIPLEVQQ